NSAHDVSAHHRRLLRDVIGVYTCDGPAQKLSFSSCPPNPRHQRRAKRVRCTLHRPFLLSTAELKSLRSCRRVFFATPLNRNPIRTVEILVNKSPASLLTLTHQTVSDSASTVGYLLGSYRIATAPELNSSRLTSFKSRRFDSPANNVGHL